MMRKAFSLAIALILAVFLMAGVLQVGSASADGGDGDPVPLDVAMQVAVNQLNGLSLDKMVPRGFSAAGEPEGLPFDASNVSGVFTVTKEGTNVYYAINLDPEGWVIVSADYVAYPIIAYSENGSYSAEDHPPAFDAWMANVENEIYDAITNDLTPLAKAIEAWKTLGAPTADFGTESSGPPVTPQSSSSVPKLMSTTWSQGGKSSFNWAWAETYDYYCPWEKNWWGFYRVSPTGCVATALGQIMRYHQWPPTGRGTHTWDPPYAPTESQGSGHASYGAYTVNFGTRNYQWSAMPNKVTSLAWDIDDNEKKVAQVLRDIGVALEMDYTPWGSGACLYKNAPGGGCYVGCNKTSYDQHGALMTLRYYYRYHATAYTERSCMTDAAWVSLLKTELNAGRPILYRGENGGGHAFVCDGYDSGGKFHFNWGWGSSHDGYYALTDLTPGSHNYTNDQGAVYGIRPDTPPVAAGKSATLYLDQNGQATLSASQVDGGSYDPDGGPVNLSINTSQFSCGHTPIQTVTLTVTDSTGNTASCTASVNVIDNTKPTVKTKDITVPLDTTGNASITAAQVNNGSSDNCGIGWLSVSPNSFTCADMGPNTVTLTVTDIHGKVATATAVVTVEDAAGPHITCPADVTLEYPADTSPNNTGTATGSDACGDVTITFSDSVVEGCGNTEVITRTWTATDECDNATSCDQVITVIDTTPPEIACPGDVTLECPADTSPENTGTATGSDTCGNVTIIYSDSVVEGCGNTEVITRTWTATDECDNATSCNQVITVIDTTPPTVDVSVSPSILWPANRKMVDIMATVTVNDNCDRAPSIVLTSVVSSEPDDTRGNVNGNTVDDIQGADIGTEDYVFSLRAERSGGGNGRIYTITYTTTDACGNSTTASITVTVPHNRGKEK